MIAVLRLLHSLARRDLQSLSTFATNNLFFCLAFLVIGDKVRNAFWSTLFLQLVLLIPVLFAIACDSISRLPPERESTWPLIRLERVVLAVVKLLVNPGLWLLTILFSFWGGLTAGIFLLGLAILVQFLVLGTALAFGGHSFPIERIIPRLPGRTGGLIQIQLRHILRTLDFYAALLLSLSTSLYRFLSSAPDPHAFPIMAVVVAIALSTLTQRTFALDGPSGVARYRLLPLSGWRLLAAKDFAHFIVAALLVLPLNLRAGLAFTVVALAVGHYPSLYRIVPQQPWRFIGGNIRFGIVQIVLGALVAGATLRLTSWFLALAVLAYVISLLAARDWWREAQAGS